MKTLFRLVIFVSLSLSWGIGVLNAQLTADFLMESIPCLDADGNYYVTFTDQSTSAAGEIVSWSWDMGDGNTYSEASFTHIYLNPDIPSTYSISLEVTDSQGNTGTVSQDLYVSPPLLDAEILVNGIPSPIYVCAGYPIQFSTNLTDSENYIFNWINLEEASNMPNPYLEEGIQDSTHYALYVTDKKSCCTYSLSIDVYTINESWPKPIINISPAPFVCSGVDVEVSAESIFGPILWMGPNDFSSSDPVLELSANEVELHQGQWFLESSNFGCETIETFNIGFIDDSLEAEIVVLSDQQLVTEVCESANVTLSAITNLDEHPEVEIYYDWYGPEGYLHTGKSVLIENFQATNADTYSVSIYTNNCNTMYLELNINVSTLESNAGEDMSHVTCYNGQAEYEIDLSTLVDPGADLGGFFEVPAGFENIPISDENMLSSSSIIVDAWSNIGGEPLPFVYYIVGPEGCRDSAKISFGIYPEMYISLEGTEFTGCPGTIIYPVLSLQPSISDVWWTAVTTCNIINQATGEIVFPNYTGQSICIEETGDFVIHCEGEGVDACQSQAQFHVDTDNNNAYAGKDTVHVHCIESNNSPIIDLFSLLGDNATTGGSFELASNINPNALTGESNFDLSLALEEGWYNEIAYKTGSGTCVDSAKIIIVLKSPPTLEITDSILFTCPNELMPPPFDFAPVNYSFIKITGVSGASYVYQPYQEILFQEAGWNLIEIIAIDSKCFAYGEIYIDFPNEGAPNAGENQHHSFCLESISTVDLKTLIDPNADTGGSFTLANAPITQALFDGDQLDLALANTYNTIYYTVNKNGCIDESTIIVRVVSTPTIHFPDGGNGICLSENCFSEIPFIIEDNLTDIGVFYCILYPDDGSEVIDFVYWHGIVNSTPFSVCLENGINYTMSFRPITVAPFCEDTVTFEVTVDPAPPYAGNDQFYQICLDDQLLIDLTNLIGPLADEDGVFALDSSISPQALTDEHIFIPSLGHEGGQVNKVSYIVGNGACRDTALIRISVGSEPQIIMNSPQITLCPGECVDAPFSVEAGITGINNCDCEVIHEQSGNLLDYVPGQQLCFPYIGIYAVECTDWWGNCSSIDYFEVTQPQLAYAGEDTNTIYDLCDDQPEFIDLLSLLDENAAIGGSFVIWSGNLTIQNYSLVDFNELSVDHYEVLYITNFAGCAADTAVISFDIIADEVLVSIQPVQPICSSDCVELQATVSSDLNCFWLPVETLSDPNILNPMVCPSSTTSYILMCVNDEADCQFSDTIEVFVENESVSIEPIEPICLGDCAQLQVSVNPDFDCFWSPTEGLSDPSILNPLVCPAQSLNLALICVDLEAACEFTDTITIEVTPSPQPNISGPPIIAECGVEVVDLFAQGTGITQYIWTAGESIWIADNDFDLPVGEGLDEIIRVEVTNSDGCTGTDSVRVITSPACLWPGDANNNGMVNHFDLLHVGLAHGMEGPERYEANLMWDEQVGMPWAESFAYGLNFRFADTDGNGVVNALDTIPILVNYGGVHGIYWPEWQENDDEGSPIFIDLPEENLQAGTIINTPIVLGTPSQPIEDVYGIAFTIEYNPELIQYGSEKLSFSDSWLGEQNTDIYAMQRHFNADGEILVAITRLDQNNISGWGNIANLEFTLLEELGGEDPPYDLQFCIKELKAIKADEAEVDLSIECMSTSIVSSIDRINHTAFSIYPIPASEKIFIEISTSLCIGDCHIKVINAKGQMVFHNNSIPEQIDISNWAAGIYLVEIVAADKVLNQKMLISR